MPSAPPQGTANTDSDDYNSDSDDAEDSSSESSDEGDDDEYGWELGKALTSPQLGPTRRSCPRNLPPGAAELPAVSIFQLQVPVPTVTVIVQETNRYAKQCQTAASKWSTKNVVKYVI